MYSNKRLTTLPALRYLTRFQIYGSKQPVLFCRPLSTRASAGSSKRVATNRPRETIPGKATSEGTEKFIADSGIQLFHKFEKSKLFVNPIIHGPPRLYPIRYKQPINRKLADNQLLTAVHRNSSNMIYVYNHYSDIHRSGFWHTNVLPHIMLKKIINGAVNPHYKPREGLVTVAGLGMVSGFDETVRRLKEARDLTGLEFIDFAIVEMSEL